MMQPSADRLKTNRPTVLVLEDKPDRQAYPTLLPDNTYHLINAHNGQQPLEQLQTDATEPTGIALVFPGNLMPVTDAHQLPERAQDATRHLPVLMLRAHAESRENLRTLRIAVAEYLLEPFAEVELLAHLDNLLTNQETCQQPVTEPADAPRPSPVVGQTSFRPSRLQISQAKQVWLGAFEQYVQKQLTDSALSVSNLAYHFAMSESTLLRQLKRLTGISPLQYIQAVRLEEARRLLESGQGQSVGQVAALVGYADAHSFRRNFRSRFGCLPSELLSK